MSRSATIAGGSTIEWTDFTWSPWHGCEKVSPGCAHCYAEGITRRYDGAGLWGEGHHFKFQNDDYWSKPLRWARTAPAKLGRRPRVFCASMADVFEHEPGNLLLWGARLRLFGLILATPELDWLVLTKRPEFALEWLPNVEDFALFEGWPIQNLWLGVSIENARFTWRADVLREIPAVVRFISAEPLLGSLYHDRKGEPWADIARPTKATATTTSRTTTAAATTASDRGVGPLDLTGIDWLIAGGESGPRARPMRLEWVRELVDACTSYGVAPFVKQLGSKPSGLHLRDRKGGDWSEWPEEFRVREFPLVAA